MNKVIYQGLISIVLFFATWYVLSLINWMTLFHIEDIGDKTEEKLGDLVWDMIRKTEIEIENSDIVNPVDKLIEKLCKSNNINKNNIKFHIIEKDEINAFALPNNRLVIYTGLITASENEAELDGVIAHELAHIELNHVMKKLVKEIGLSALILMTTGNAEMIGEIIHLLSSTAYDRTMEKEADLKAVEYLINARINPEDFANFLYKLSEEESEFAEQLSWINTHPATKKRAEYIIKHNEKINKGHKKYKHILSEKKWKDLQAELEY